MGLIARCLPSAAGWGSELLAMRVLAYRAPRAGYSVCVFDVRVHAIRRMPGRRRPFEVRWHAAGRARSQSFITRGLAEGYRAELIRVARCGLDFSPITGGPARWAGRETPSVSWLEHASAYAVMKWPHSAAHTRASIADTLATVTPALLTPGYGTPPVRLLRAALYQQAFTQAGPGSDPGARDLPSIEGCGIPYLRAAPYVYAAPVIAGSLLRHARWMLMS